MSSPKKHVKVSGRVLLENEIISHENRHLSPIPTQDIQLDETEDHSEMINDILVGKLKDGENNGKGDQYAIYLEEKEKYIKNIETFADLLYNQCVSRE